MEIKRRKERDAQGGTRTLTPKRAWRSHRQLSTKFQHLRADVLSDRWPSTIGTAGFEPATSCPPDTRSDQAELRPVLSLDESGE